MGNLTANANKNPCKQAKMTKQRKNAGICRDKKEKGNTKKITTKLVELKQNILAKEGRLKRYRQRLKQYRQNR